ncbi:MAG: hypothetical protein KDA60_15600 [Planctomycetales bacterium]|nr:hypothetical protein [Planctomycetales bacterium]
MNDNPSNAIATRTRRFFANLAEVRQSLALMEDLSEIKDVRDKAEAIRQYAKSAGHGLDLQNDAAEIRLRAERRAGAILATMRLRGGDRRSTNQDRRGGTTLKENRHHPQSVHSLAGVGEVGRRRL